MDTMKSSLKYFLLCCCLLALAGQYAAAQDDYATLISDATSDDYPDADIVVLFDSMEVDVQKSGLSYVTMHKLTKILTPKGALENRTVIYGYDPLSAAVDVRLVRIHRKDGTVETLPESRVYDYPAPARAIYWGAREKAIEIGRLDPGDAVETVAFRKGFTYALLAESEIDDEMFIPPMKGHFYDIVEFWSPVPVKEKVYRVFLPESMKLQYEVYSGGLLSYVHYPPEKTNRYTVDVNPQAKTMDTPEDDIHPTSTIVTKPGKITYCWYKRDIEPFKGEKNMVSHSNVAPKLLLSTSPDWYAKAVWFHGVNEDYQSFAVTPEVKAKVDELLKGVTDEMEKISILTHWAAENIRYSGISMGEGEGYTLHTGEMTFADRCGVCKDKASMLITMLRAAGFESYPAMTMAGSRIDRIPADQFNHSVTVVRRSNGNWMLLDPTWVPGVRELWSSAEQQQGYLMGVPGGSDLMYTPVSPSENHYWKLTGESTLAADGMLTGEFTLEAEGQSDATIRRLFNRSYRSAMEEYLPEVLYRISPKAEILDHEIWEPYDISKPMRIWVRYRIPAYAAVGGDRAQFTPLLARNLFSHSYMTPEFGTDTSLTERSYGFRMRCSKLVEINEKVVLPPGMKVIAAPETRQVDGEWSTLDASYSQTGNMLTFKLVHDMKKRVYEAEDWQDFRAALVGRMQFTESPVTLQR
ncbi:MAG: transglutaminase [Ectothiorhodospiraceae bacterium]|nr:transglutaminase [Ectothiorhodospiraceae bacterium]